MVNKSSNAGHKVTLTSVLEFLRRDGRLNESVIPRILSQPLFAHITSSQFSVLSARDFRKDVVGVDGITPVTHNTWFVGAIVSDVQLPPGHRATNNTFNRIRHEFGVAARRRLETPNVQFYVFDEGKVSLVIRIPFGFSAQSLPPQKVLDPRQDRFSVVLGGEYTPLLGNAGFDHRIHSVLERANSDRSPVRGRIIIQEALRAFGIDPARVLTERDPKTGVIISAPVIQAAETREVRL